MSEIELEPNGEKITIRLRLSVEEAVKIRNDLKEEYTNIPKLNKETFESFGQWVFEDINDSLTDFFEFEDEHAQNKIGNENTNNDDDPSEFEPW